MSRTTLSSKFQIVIPKRIRTMLKLKSGMAVHVTPIDDRHALITKEPTSHTNAMRGLGKDMWKKIGPAQTYIKNERSSWRDSSE